MSQHAFETEHQGRTAVVMLGWDRPLQHYFLVVEIEDVEVPLYSNLDQIDAFELTLDDYRRVLRDLGISIPESMFEQTLADGTNNTGNRFVLHQADGTFYE